MRVRTAGRIVISQPVNDCNLGAPADNGGNVNCFRVPRFQHRNDLELLQYGSNFRRVFRLQRAYYDILASLAAAAALVEHLERFAYAGGIAEENLEAAPPFTKLLQFTFPEQLLRAWPVGRIASH